jgi:hypothetical protein
MTRLTGAESPTAPHPLRSSSAADLARGPVRVRTSEGLIAVEREGLPSRDLTGRHLSRRGLRRRLFRPGLRRPGRCPVPDARKSKGSAARRRLAAAVPAIKHSRRVVEAMNASRVLVVLRPPAAEPPLAAEVQAVVLLMAVDVAGERSRVRRPIPYGGHGDVAIQRCQRKKPLQR